MSSLSEQIKTALSPAKEMTCEDIANKLSLSTGMVLKTLQSMYGTDELDCARETEIADGQKFKRVIWFIKTKKERARPDFSDVKDLPRPPPLTYSTPLPDPPQKMASVISGIEPPRAAMTKPAAPVRDKLAPQAPRTRRTQQEIIRDLRVEAIKRGHPSALVNQLMARDALEELIRMKPPAQTARFIDRPVTVEPPEPAPLPHSHAPGQEANDERRAREEIREGMRTDPANAPGAMAIADFMDSPARKANATDLDKAHEKQSYGPISENVPVPEISSTEKDTKALLALFDEWHTALSEAMKVRVTLYEAEAKATRAKLVFDLALAARS